MKKALVCGAGGFVGGHVAKYLKQKGYFVRGADIKPHQWSQDVCDEFFVADLRHETNCIDALTLEGGPFDEVYQFAADMGGMGFISTKECEIMHDNVLINTHMIHNASELGVPRYFFSSSVCVYPDMRPGDPEMTEDDAIPAQPDNEYGWEKLYSERMALTYARNKGIQARVARFQNTYGPETEWIGGKEKAPAAICRKVAEAPEGGTIEVWGDGSAIRSFTYIDDLVRGIDALMHSDLDVVTNIGSDEYVTVDQLVQTAIAVSGKEINIKHVAGPVGVQSRNFSLERIRSLGWDYRYSLREGIEKLYPWVKERVEELKQNGA